MKVVAIGIGSVIFGIELLRDVFRVPELKGAELWLVDVAEQPLARMSRTSFAGCSGSAPITAATRP